MWFVSPNKSFSYMHYLYLSIHCQIFSRGKCCYWLHTEFNWLLINTMNVLKCNSLLTNYVFYFIHFFFLHLSASLGLSCTICVALWLIVRLKNAFNLSFIRKSVFYFTMICIQYNHHKNNVNFIIGNIY